MEQLYSIEQIKTWLEFQYVKHLENGTYQYVVFADNITHENIKKANEINDPDQGALDL